MRLLALPRSVMFCNQQQHYYVNSSPTRPTSVYHADNASARQPIPSLENLQDQSFKNQSSRTSRPQKQEWLEPTSPAQPRPKKVAVKGMHCIVASVYTTYVIYRGPPAGLLGQLKAFNKQAASTEGVVSPTSRGQAASPGETTLSFHGSTVCTSHPPMHTLLR